MIVADEGANGIVDVRLRDDHYQRLLEEKEGVLDVVALGKGLAGLHVKDKTNLRVFGTIFQRSPFFPDLWLDPTNIVAVRLNPVRRSAIVVCKGSSTLMNF